MDELTAELDYNRLAREWFLRSLRHLAHCRHEHCAYYSFFYYWLVFEQALSESQVAYLIAGFPPYGKIANVVKGDKDK